MTHSYHQGIDSYIIASSTWHYHIFAQLCKVSDKGCYAQNRDAVIKSIWQSCSLCQSLLSKSTDGLAVSPGVIFARGGGTRHYLQIMLTPLFLDVIVGLGKRSQIFFVKY